MLEKTRIVKQPKVDRNYHIFYELLHGAPDALKTQLKLKTPKDYVYLSQSNLTIVAPADDAKAFKNVSVRSRLSFVVISNTLD